MSKVYNIRKELSEDLALRDTAIRFFSHIEKEPAKELIIDFSGVKTITRSFADEYLKRKEQSKKTIKEEHLPLNINKMFEIVKITKYPETKLIMS